MEKKLEGIFKFISNSLNNSQDTKFKILTASFTLISDFGLFSTTIVDIANKSYLSRKSIYNYYSTIDDILIDLQDIIIKYILNKSYLLYISQNEKQQSSDCLEIYLSIIHRTITQNSDILNFIVKSDFYIYRTESLLNKKITLKDNLISNSLIPLYMCKIYNDKSYNKLQSKINILIESFIGYIVRVSYRKEIYKIDSKRNSTSTLAQFLVSAKNIIHPGENS